MSGGYMTWEQKLAALNALGESQLLMRKPGDWYISARREFKEREAEGFLVGRYGNGPTPEAAVHDEWEQLALASERGEGYVVLHAMDNEKRRHVRWNGFMWEDGPR